MPPAPLYGPERSGVTSRLLHILLPAPCLKCGEPLPAAAPLGLCASCRSRLAPLPREACAVCAGLLDAFEPPPGYRCGACRKRPPAYERLLARWLYREPLDAVIQALKFSRLDYLGRPTTFGAQYHGGSNAWDPSRLAAEVVSGIGFLGAGTIIQARGRVHGLTTAAGLWVAAAIGIAVGARYYQEAAVTSVALLVILMGLRPVERLFGKRKKRVAEAEDKKDAEDTA